MKSRLSTLMCAIAAAVLSLPAAAQTCNSGIPLTKPDDRYEDHEDGTVTDTATGLMWKKCSEGQTWNAAGNGCDGSVTTYNWNNALGRAVAVNAGGAGERLDHDDWRLPNVKELKSLVEDACYNPSINETLFPGTPSNWYWSSSPHASDTNDAWSVDFSFGNGGWGGKDGSARARLVRAGQSLASLPEAGQCGSAHEVATLVAPAMGLCAAGAASAVTSGNGGHGWSCAGVGGGTNAICSAPGLASAGSGSGNVTAAFDGAGCTVDSATLAAPSAGGPAGVDMPFGALDFALSGCSGGSVTVTATFPGSVAGMEYWKYIGGQWQTMPATLSGNTATFTLVDNGPFDANPALGSIADPGGPGVSAGAESEPPLPIPALSWWGALSLAGLLALLGVAVRRRGSRKDSRHARAGGHPGF